MRLGRSGFTIFIANNVPHFLVVKSEDVFSHLHIKLSLMKNFSKGLTINEDAIKCLKKYLKVFQDQLCKSKIGKFLGNYKRTVEYASIVSEMLM